MHSPRMTSLGHTCQALAPLSTIPHVIVFFVLCHIFFSSQPVSCHSLQCTNSFPLPIMWMSAAFGAHQHRHQRFDAACAAGLEHAPLVSVGSFVLSCPILFGSSYHCPPASIPIVPASHRVFFD
eukprot:RCo050227